VHAQGLFKSVLELGVLELHVLDDILLVLIFVHDILDLFLDFLVLVALLVTFFKTREHFLFDLHEHLIAALLYLSL
jgi:hypothetical protein